MKTIICIGLLFAVSAVCFAQNDGEIDSLIKNGLNRNFESIQREAADLDEAERLEIYNRNQMSKWLWFAAPAPFGIGNFIQGDKVWGGVVLAGQVLGGGLLTAGALMTVGSLPLLPFFVLFPKGYKMMEIGPYLMLGGGIAFAVSHIAGVIRAFTYLPAYNSKLRTDLQLDTMTMSIEPSVNISMHGVELTLVSAAF